ncbi:MAG: segregation and condensation protein A, partial [Anaerolineales bacterium]
ETVQQRAAGEVSAFLVIAARLVQIKSEALLPHPPERETREEDPGESLAQQLAVYKRYKEIALGLGKREARGLHTYIRLAVLPKISGKVELNGVGLSDLVTSAARVFSVPEAKTPLKTVVSAPKVTIREKIRLIVDAIRSQGWIVVSFLALLELIKLRRVSVQQETLFEDIVINPAEAWSDDEDFELEFGE